MTMKTKRPPKTVRLGCEAWLVAILESSPVWWRDSHSAGVMSVMSFPFLRSSGVQSGRFPSAYPSRAARRTSDTLAAASM